MVSHNIGFQFIRWYLIEVPREILKGWGNFLRFVPRYFSIGLLCRTLFAPWKSYTWDYGRGFDLGRWLEAFFSNLITRTIGAFVRIIFIAVGIVFELATFLVGAFLFATWFLVPFLMAKSFVLGLSLL